MIQTLKNLAAASGKDLDSFYQTTILKIILLITKKTRLLFGRIGKLSPESQKKLERELEWLEDLERKMQGKRGNRRSTKCG